MLIAVIFFAASLLLNLRNLKSFRQKLFPILLSLLISGVLVCFFPAPINAVKEKAESLTILGEAYLKIGDIEKSQELILLASELDPDWSRNHNILGMIYEKKGMLNEAEGAFFRATNCSDSDKSAFMNLAMLYDKKGEDKLGEAFWRRALSTKKTVELFYNYAVKLQKDGHNDEALSYYLDALEKQAWHQGALNNAGTLILLKGDARTAVQFFKKAFAVTDRKLDTGINLAVAFFENGEKIKALNTLDEIAKFAKSEEERKKLSLVKTQIGKF
jgi:Tfp pilus assembly protein PilF